VFYRPLLRVLVSYGSDMNDELLIDIDAVLHQGSGTPDHMLIYPNEYVSAVLRVQIV
jgi:hypothetical protein